MKDSSISHKFSSFCFPFKLFCIFPAKLNSNSKYISTSFVHRSFCWFILISTGFYALQLNLAFIKNNYFWKNSLSNTDRFAFALFIFSYNLERFLFFLISLSKTNSICRVLNKLQNYDFKYLYQSKNSPFSLVFFTFFTISFLSLFCNGYVSFDMFKVMICDNCETNFYFYGIKTTNSFLAFLSTFSAFSLCELAFIFFISIFYFFVNSICQRVDNLREEVLEEYTMKYFRVKNNSFCERFKDLIVIRKELNNCFGEFLLVFISFCLISFITAIHVALTYVMNIAPNERQDANDHGLWFVFFLVGFYIFKLGVLVHVGDKLWKNVRYILKFEFLVNKTFKGG
jgi:hypothetical protein